MKHRIAESVSDYELIYTFSVVDAGRMKPMFVVAQCDRFLEAPLISVLGALQVTEQFYLYSLSHCIMAPKS